MERQRLNNQEGLQMNDEYELDDTEFLTETFLIKLMLVAKEIEEE